MENPHDRRYRQEGFYWGVEPSPICQRILGLKPPDRRPRLLDIGCGEGRNAVFFAGNGYRVSALDSSSAAVAKTRQLALERGVVVDAFQADVRGFRLGEVYDVLFSTGTLHYLPGELRNEVFANYRAFTAQGGLNVFSVLVRKPFIERAPDAEETACVWRSGELLMLYHDWKIEHFTEEVFDCMSSGVPHQHAVNRMIARKVQGD